MMQLKLDNNPLETPRARVMNPAPKPEIKLQPPASAAVSLFRPLPANACDVAGCKKYGHAFPSEHALLEHKRAVHQRPVRQSSINYQLSPAPVAQASTAEPAKKFQCKNCQAAFADSLQYASHIRLVHKVRATKEVNGKLRWVCPHCPKLVSSRKSLNNHITREHPSHGAPSTPGQYKCAHCELAFASKQKLGAHVQWTHKRPRAATIPKHPHPEAVRFFIRFTGNKADCGKAAFILIQNGFSNLTTGEM